MSDIHVEDVKIRMMDVTKMMGQVILGIKKDHLEIRPGLSDRLKLMSRIAPQFILNRLSKPAGAMLEQATPR